MRNIKKITLVAFVVLSVAWTAISANEWAKSKEVLFKQDIVSTKSKDRCLCFEDPDTYVLLSKIRRAVVVSYKDVKYVSLDSDIVNDVFCNHYVDVIGLTLVSRGKDGVIVAYRYYDSQTNTYHDVQTDEASLWWTKSEPNFVECLFSFDFMNYIL